MNLRNRFLVDLIEGGVQKRCLFQLSSLTNLKTLMSKSRMINTSIWDDDYVLDLEPNFNTANSDKTPEIHILYSEGRGGTDFKFTQKLFELFASKKGDIGKMAGEYILISEIGYTLQNIEAGGELIQIEEDWRCGYNDIREKLLNDYLELQNIINKFLTTDTTLKLEDFYNKSQIQQIKSIPALIGKEVAMINYRVSVFEKTRIENKAPKKQPVGSVYVIHDTILDKYKIGWSKNPKSRVKGLQISTANKLDLIYTSPQIESPCTRESFFHEYFSNKRQASEWFELDTKDLEFIKQSF